MIPLILPPLSGLGVLVTRPVGLTDALCERLLKLGANTLPWPSITIEPSAFDVSTITHCDALIFISVHAVQHGRALLEAHANARIIAVGQATAEALTSLGHSIDAVPDQGSSSEALLAHPLLLTPPKHITLVRGQGGRELLQHSLSERGATVSIAEVYERRPTVPSEHALTVLSQELQAGTLDVVTATSVAILDALHSQLSAPLLAQLKTLTLLCGSKRIASAARQRGWQGEQVIAFSPTDADVVNELCRWQTRQH